MNLFNFNKKNKNKSQHLDENSEDTKDFIKQFKRNIVNKTGVIQQQFGFEENTDIKDIKAYKGTKKGLGYSIEKLTENHIDILQKCTHENTAAELMKILKRTNKTKFKQAILIPLIETGFFELTVPKKLTSPKQKYRLTGKFVKKFKF